MSTDRSSAPKPWPGPLAIAAVGACTCFGGATTAAAAARAGLSRARALPDATYVDETTKETTPVSGAPIVGVTDGYEGTGRLARMSQLGLEDMLAATAWIHPRRIEAFLVAPTLDEGAASRIGATLERTLGAPPGSARVHARGAAGTAVALREAAEALRAGRCDHAVVGACDSWLDPDRLRGIAEVGRLKTRDQPVGFIPGEASVFVLLERASVLADGLARAVANVVGLHEAVGEPLGSETPPSGAALAHVARAGMQPSCGAVYVDLNGERHRAVDWGMALARLGPQPAPGFRREQPAASFGDTGAASALLGVSLAARAFARGYAVGDRALVLSIGDGPARLGIVVERAGAATAGRA